MGILPLSVSTPCTAAAGSSEKEAGRRGGGLYTGGSIAIYSGGGYRHRPLGVAVATRGRSGGPRGRFLRLHTAGAGPEGKDGGRWREGTDAKAFGGPN